MNILSEWFFWSSKIGPPEKRTYAQRYESGLAASEQLLLQRSGEDNHGNLRVLSQCHQHEKVCKALIRPNLREYSFKNNSLNKALFLWGGGIGCTRKFPWIEGCLQVSRLTYGNKSAGSFGSLLVDIRRKHNRNSKHHVLQVDPVFWI